MRLHWELHPGEGSHLLLVHGFLTSQAQWMLNLPALGEVCRPVTVELWGHGRSPSPEDPACYAPEHYLEQFEQIRIELGARRWDLLGYSLGAGLTIRYAMSHPERVTRHLFTNSISAFAPRAMSETWRRGGEQAAMNILAGGQTVMQRIAVHPRHARRLPDPVYRALMADAELHQPLGIANTVRYTTPEVSVRYELSGNSTPALLLCGTREKRFQPHREFVETHMPNMRVAELSAGHGVNMEAHGDFDRAVTGFISEGQRS
ncbi:MAG: alpha/beta fold hydrolase [Gammaproteobacteria bacterium]|nr:alpha/beta fold hydrolase [Gammaproteobacteria bacterium]